MTGVFRWGLLGAGDIVKKRVAAALRDAPGSELLAIARARGELAESFAKACQAPRWYTPWQALLADDDVHAVYVATPVHLHAAQTIAAAEAGKHVLCEKPMAMTVGECDRMIAACRAHNVKLGVAYYRHFYPVIQRMKSIIASGEIGAVVFAQVNAFEPFNPAPDHPRHWFMDKAQAGGGPMFDFGCHRLEVLMNLLGPVQAATGLVANVVFDRDVEDTAAALLRFEGGPPTSLGAGPSTSLRAGPCAAVAVTHGALEPQDTLSIFGTAGSIHVAPLNAGEARIVTAGEVRVERHPPAANLHAPLIEDFVDAVSHDREPAVTGVIGRVVNVLLEQIYDHS